jgi:hypothetical protein
MLILASGLILRITSVVRYQLSVALLYCRSSVTAFLIRFAQKILLIEAKNKDLEIVEKNLEKF